MKTDHSMFNRRGFIKRGALFLPAIFLPKFGENPIVVELFNRDGSEVFHLPRYCPGLQAASTIKQRTYTSIVDNRIRLTNSNFARLWSTDIGTSWTTIRIGCRISIEDSGAATTGTARFAFGVCSGTSNIYMDATTTHWLGALTNTADWTRTAGPPARVDMSGYTGGGGVCDFCPAKRITSTLTVGAIFATAQGIVYDCTTENRTAFFLDITKGSPNFTLSVFHRNTATASDVTLTAYLAQVVLGSPALTNHATMTSATIAIDEGANGSFNAVNVAWDRTSPAIEISDLAVVKLA
jgi:hypothetical protein